MSRSIDPGHTLDVRGRPCPEPVIRTRAALSTATADGLVVLVDAGESVENIQRSIQPLGWSASCVDRADHVEMTIRRQAEVPASPASPASRQPSMAGSPGEVPAADPVRPTLFIGSQYVGEGAPELGTLLMRSAIKTVKELSPLPDRVIFMNSGVLLTVEGSPLLTDLQELERNGIELLACGTCLDFYRVKEQLQAGRVSNMYEILSCLATAHRLVRL